MLEIGTTVAVVPESKRKKRGGADETRIGVVTGFIRKGTQVIVQFRNYRECFPVNQLEPIIAP